MKTTIYILGALASTYASIYLFSKFELVSAVLFIIPLAMFCSAIRVNTKRS